MTDFDRFKLYKTKQRMNREINRKFLVLKAKAKKEVKKAPKLEKKEKPQKKKVPKKPKTEKKK
jgi:hypothetical protein